MAVVLVVAAAGLSASDGISTQSRASAAMVPPTISGVESLYSQDLVARINAERAVRNSASVPVPKLQVDGQLQAAAQAWSAHLASIGTVVDPTLPPCSGSICLSAANSGDTGYGFWPGDGSDGMDGAYMNSAGHRQNELGAAYTYVGVGVSCSGGQAYTVELFGYANTDSSANARRADQTAVGGDPLPTNPVVAGTPSGSPVYCPGQTVGPNGATTGTGGQYPYPYSVPSVPGEPNGNQVVGLATSANSGGYWLARADGTVSDHGGAKNYGSLVGDTLAASITHIVATPDGNGYWLVASDGGVFAFGDATFHGSMGGLPLNAPVVGMAPTHDGNGYWLVASDGGIFAFGDASFEGSMGGRPLNKPVVGMATDTATNGYWLVASDGGVFAFNARFAGSTGNLNLNKAVNGMAATPDGGGYWFVASDGGVFAFGDARFHGSTGGLTLNAPIVGMAADSGTGGYWLVGGDGGIFAFGSPFYGAG